MSLILEALKKSEKERLGDNPVVPLVAHPQRSISAKAGRKRRQKLPILILSGIILLAAAVLIWMASGSHTDTGSVVSEEKVQQEKSTASAVQAESDDVLQAKPEPAPAIPEKTPDPEPGVTAPAVQTKPEVDLQAKPV